MIEPRNTQVTSLPEKVNTTLTRVDTSAVRLVALTGVSKGKSFEMESTAPIVVGAGAGCDFKVEDPTVSGNHARFTKTEWGVRIEDLESTNGTFYEKSKVKVVEIPFGAKVTLGKAQIKVVPLETAVKTEPSSVARFGDLVGEDVRMREMFSLLADVAPTDATVVIEGETGTGKELVARALHDNSSRVKNPFVVFDCSAVPRELIESALFGHVKGSFTGATSTRQGAFRRAHKGTIFLDEIGELPIDLQPKLLRALESRSVQMVGGDAYEAVNVRVVCATNRHLKREVRAGKFREDLYYRLAVVRIVLPPLRERLDDLPVLVRHFLNRDNDGAEVNPDSLMALRNYDWPGNVRELKNVVERAKSLWHGPDPIEISQFLPGARVGLGGFAEESSALHGHPSSRNDKLGEILGALYRALDRETKISFRDAKALVVEAFERRYLTQLMEESGGNISRAAQGAQMDRKHLRELLKKYDLWQDKS